MSANPDALQLHKQAATLAVNDPAAPKPSMIAMVESIMRSYGVVNSQQKQFNALIYGPPASGKTAILRTCRKPVLVDMFDPFGHKTQLLADDIAKGNILVRYYGHDRWHHPTMFSKWMAEYEQAKQQDLFRHLGTYCLDSLTSFTRYMAYHIAAKNGKSKSDGTLSLADYKLQLYQIMDLITDMMNLPCDVIVTAHIQLEIDNFANETHTYVALPPSQRTEVPTAFMEKWITRVINGKHVLQVKPDGKYMAETRIGSTAFNTIEEQDVKKLLAKVGLNTEDLPSLVSSASSASSVKI